MSLKRAIKNGANVILIDDFMKGGGTAKGMIDIMKEFDASERNSNDCYKGAEQ